MAKSIRRMECGRPGQAYERPVSIARPSSTIGRDLRIESSNIIVDSGVSHFSDQQAEVVMMRVTQAASFVLATVGAFSLSANAQETKKPAATFEIRLAESEPAEGLKPATVEGSKTKIYLHKEASL